MKTLKRTVIIRDSDLDRLVKKSVWLYDRIDIEPMTYKGIQQEILIETLKNPDHKGPERRTLPSLYEHMLYKEKSLYDRRYLNWYLTMDYPDGQIYVQSKAHKDNTREPLHRVVFEKDYA